MKRLVALVFAVICLAACQKAPFLSIESPASINFAEHGDKQTITFLTNRDWKIESSESWCTLSSSSGSASDSPISVVVTCEKNSSDQARSCVINILAGDIHSTVTVSQEKWIAVESIEILKNDDYVVVREGETTRLELSITPDNTSEKSIIWTSSNPAVATVADGNITAKRIGTSRVSVQIGSITATCVVAVTGRSFSGLCLEAIDVGEVVITNPLNFIYEYSKDQENWVASSDSEIRISFTSGDIISLRGDNRVCARVDNSSDIVKYTNINCTADCYIYGNVNSLIRRELYDAFSAHLIEKDNIATVNLRKYSYMYLFQGNKHIKSHPTKPLQLYFNSCMDESFYGMFIGCSSLTNPPQFITRSDALLGEACFAYMFASCENLRKAPDLPFVDLSRSADTFLGMFMGCTNLVEAPVLPAQKLSKGCYESMFSGCSSLTTAPDLPSLTLVENCYYGMFSSCSSLSHIKMMATDINSSQALQYWVIDVSPTGTFIKNVNAKWDITGDSGIPTGWNVKYSDN